jgi:hypothetical protein
VRPDWKFCSEAGKKFSPRRHQGRQSRNFLISCWRLGARYP